MVIVTRPDLTPYVCMSHILCPTLNKIHSVENTTTPNQDVSSFDLLCSLMTFLFTVIFAVW